MLCTSRGVKRFDLGVFRLKALTFGVCALNSSESITVGFANALSLF